MKCRQQPSSDEHEHTPSKLAHCTRYFESWIKANEFLNSRMLMMILGDSSSTSPLHISFRELDTQPTCSSLQSPRQNVRTHPNAAVFVILGQLPNIVISSS